MAPQTDRKLAIVTASFDNAPCGRYVGRVVKNVNAAAPTPDWMKRRLERSGLRSISAIVDITNYILLEQGQPMHAFDLDKINGGITVHMAADGEKLVCLNEKEVALTPDLMVIADDQQPLAIAGIMGGLESGVTTASRDIFSWKVLFSLKPSPARPVPWASAPFQLPLRARCGFCAADRSHRARHSALVLDICGGDAGPLTETIGQLPQRGSVTVRTARVAKVLGVALSAEQIAAIFTRLGLAFEQNDAGFVDDARRASASISPSKKT